LARFQGLKNPSINVPEFQGSESRFDDQQRNDQNRAKELQNTTHLLQFHLIETNHDPQGSVGFAKFRSSKFFNVSKYNTTLFRGFTFHTIILSSPLKFSE
jgi:hypothetical protein